MNLYTTQKNCFFKILLAVRKKGGKNLWKILFLFSFILIGSCFYIEKCDAATNAIITGASSLNIRSGLTDFSRTDSPVQLYRKVHKSKASVR